MGASRSCLYKIPSIPISCSILFILKFDCPFYHKISLAKPHALFVYSKPLNWMSYFCNLLFSFPPPRCCIEWMPYAVLTNTYLCYLNRGQRTAPYNVSDFMIIEYLLMRFA